LSDSHIIAETFRIPAMDCPEEFLLIEKGLRRLEGVRQIYPDYLNRSLRVEFDAEKLDTAAVADQLRHIGFPGEPLLPQHKSGRPPADIPRLRATTIAGGLLLAAAAMAFAASIAPPWIAALAILSTIASGWPVAWAALRAVRLARLDMNALMTIAATGALITGPTTGEWLEAPTAMFLFGVSLWLESYSLGRARRAVQTLVELTPTVAHRLENHVPADAAADYASLDASAHCVTDVSPDELAVGDYLLVKPGERIPVDGVVVAGSSTVNQAPITGESMPIEKSAADNVFAGSLNEEGALTVRAAKTSSDSTLAHVTRLVEQAQSTRSPTERFVDRFARRYTPAVISLAVLLVAGPPVWSWLGLSGEGAMSLGEWLDWLHRGLVLLVIACPCALVISTPITIVCGLHQAARYGILVKGGQYLETAGRVDCVAIDKTGTLTEGRPHVVDVKCTGGHSPDNVLQIAAALECNSEHPLAAAIVAAARQRNLAWQPGADFAALRGFGVRGTVDGQSYFVASPRFFYEQKLGGGEIPEQWLIGDGASTVALVGSNQQLLGAIYLADQPRDDAVEAIARLKRLGVKNVVMLTGDSAATASRVAHAVGIEEVHAELLPQEKVARVESLAARYPHLAMVGDGVNDAPAFAAAAVGIALGSQSSDTALETADVVVLSPRLSRLPQLFELGQRTRRLLSQNIFLALAIKSLVLLLAAFGLATMWMAVAADVGASMVVIFNGMRLLKREEE
jgi:Cd2+/Zn2+-exporting ATPase